MTRDVGFPALQVSQVGQAPPESRVVIGCGGTLNAFFGAFGQEGQGLQGPRITKVT